MDLSDSIVLVTGATSGIGRATAERFARLGADVVVSGRDATRGQVVTDGIRSAGGTARFLAADLADPRDTVRLADAVGAVDVIVDNAGGSVFVPTAALSEEQIRQVFELNVIAPLLLVQRLAPAMIARGRGAIVNVSSYASEHGIPFLPAYGAAKAGLDALTRAWALDYGPSGVRMNSVAPGSVRTPPAEVLGDEFDRTASATPLGRAATAEEIAQVIAFLASDDASYITGAVIRADAGMSAG